MTSRLALAAFVVAGLAGTVAAVGWAAPQLAPDVMTMDTMANHLDVERYEDTGRCDFWVTNMSNPTERIEREFSCGFFWDWSLQDEEAAYVREALWDHEADDVFEVPNMDRGRMEEYYHVDGHMLTSDALSFQANASEDPGVLMPPPEAREAVTMGWVSSGGEYGGAQRLVHARELTEQGTETLQGIEVVHWNSSFEREDVTWHGYDVYLTEHVDMLSDPQTAWVLEMRRHVVVEMTPSQMAAAQGHDVPAAMDGEPQRVMELVYETNPPAIAAHAEQATFFQRLMLPIDHGEALSKLGSATAALSLVAGLATRTVSGLFGVAYAGRHP